MIRSQVAGNRPGAASPAAGGGALRPVCRVPHSPLAAAATALGGSLPVRLLARRLAVRGCWRASCCPALTAPRNPASPLRSCRALGWARLRSGGALRRAPVAGAPSPPAARLPPLFRPPRWVRGGNKVSLSQALKGGAGFCAAASGFALALRRAGAAARLRGARLGALCPAAPLVLPWLVLLFGLLTRERPTTIS